MVNNEKLCYRRNMIDSHIEQGKIDELHFDKTERIIPRQINMYSGIYKDKSIGYIIQHETLLYNIFYKKQKYIETINLEYEYFYEIFERILKEKLATKEEIVKAFTNCSDWILEELVNSELSFEELSTHDLLKNDLILKFKLTKHVIGYVIERNPQYLKKLLMKNDDYEVGCLDPFVNNLKIYNLNKNKMYKKVFPLIDEKHEMEKQIISKYKDFNKIFLLLHLYKNSLDWDKYKSETLKYKNKRVVKLNRKKYWEQYHEDKYNEEEILHNEEYYTKSLDKICEFDSSYEDEYDEYGINTNEHLWVIRERKLHAIVVYAVDNKKYSLLDRLLEECFDPEEQLYYENYTGQLNESFMGLIYLWIHVFTKF